MCFVNVIESKLVNKFRFHLMDPLWLLLDQLLQLRIFLFNILGYQLSIFICLLESINFLLQVGCLLLGMINLNFNSLLLLLVSVCLPTRLLESLLKSIQFGINLTFLLQNLLVHLLLVSKVTFCCLKIVHKLGSFSQKERIYLSDLPIDLFNLSLQFLHSISFSWEIHPRI